MTAQPTPVASSSRVKLDSACPIAWHSSSSASQHSITSTSSQHAAASSSHLRQRYHECLWLGEAYLPLVAFPSYAFDMSSRRREQDVAEAGATLDGIASLLRTRGQVQRRFRKEMPDKVAAALSRQGRDEDDDVKEGEEEMYYVSAALTSGPGRSVADEHRQMTAAAAAAAAAQTAEESHSATVKTTRIRDDWLVAIERRELSLQLLLILEALRIGVEHPSLLITPNAASPPRLLARPAPMPLQSSQTNHDDASVDAEAGAHGTESQSRTSTTRKKKRKAAPARRWTGFATAMALQGAVDDDGFPWAKRSTSSTKSGGTDLVTPGGENDDDDDEAAAFNAKTTVRDPEALHKLFEAFADRLSLRIVTSELRLDFLGLDEEMDKQAGEGSAAASKAKAKAILFGTAARLREDGDERDEMHHLCSDIVEPRFARSLPRQCSVLRSKATVGGGGSHATPHRSRSSLNTTTGRGGTASAERQRRREEQQHSQLARIRSEADLATRKKLADEKARAKEAKRLSQRPGLKDALVMEQKERKFSRATSVVGGDAERNKREVSVKRRVGSLVRGASSGNVWDESSQQSQSAPAIPTMMKSGSLVLGPSAARVNKRKIAEPKRFGGHADGHAVKGELDDDVDNPFRDLKPAAAAAMPQGEDSQVGIKRLKPTTGVFTRSESQVFSSKAASSSQSQGPFSGSLLAPPPIAAAGRRSLTGWQRTESQPVTSRDLSSLSSASASRSSSRQGSRRASPFFVDDDEAGSDVGLDDEEEEEQGDAPMLLRRPTNAGAAPGIQSQSGAMLGSRPLHGLGGLRTWTKTTSMAELPAFDLSVNGNGQSESQPSFVPPSGASESQGVLQESQGLAAAARELPPLAPSTSSIITSTPAAAAAASQSDLSSMPPAQPTVSLTAASPPRPRPPMPPPLRRRPSGRNPFAKSASQQRLETATVVAAAAAADPSTSQATPLDSGADGQGDDMMASSSGGSSMAADLGRLWRGDSSKWG